MWAADARPAFDAAVELAEACASNPRSRNREIDAAVLAALSAVGANSQTYQDAGVAGILHTVVPKNFPGPGSLIPEDMRWLYTHRFLRKKIAAAQAIYIRLRNSGPNGYCAYCRYQSAGTLDHFLPKAEFGMLAIEPWNLVPCCHDCNNTREETSADARLLHPYFHTAPLGRWLYGAVDTYNPVTLKFFAQPDRILSDDIKRRVTAQFLKLKLADLYRKIASDTIANAKADLRRGRKESEHFDLSQARAHLVEESERAFCVDPNLLRGVVYEALATDETFILQTLAA